MGAAPALRLSPRAVAVLALPVAALTVGELPRDLSHPCAGWSACYACNLDTAAFEINDEEHPKPNQAAPGEHLDSEEVARRKRLPVAAPGLPVLRGTPTSCRSARKNVLQPICLLRCGAGSMPWLSNMRFTVLGLSSKPRFFITPQIRL